MGRKGLLCDGFFFFSSPLCCFLEPNGAGQRKGRAPNQTKRTCHAMPVGNPKSDRDCLCRDKDNRIANLATAFFLYVNFYR